MQRIFNACSNFKQIIFGNSPLRLGYVKKENSEILSLTYYAYHTYSDTHIFTVFVFYNRAFNFFFYPPVIQIDQH